MPSCCEQPSTRLSPQVEHKIASKATLLESLQLAYSWEDPAVTRLALLLHFALTGAAAALHAAALAAFAASPLHLRHYCLLLGLLAFVPAPHATLAILDGIDAAVRDYALADPASVAAGSGLAAARRPEGARKPSAQPSAHPSANPSSNPGGGGRGVASSAAAAMQRRVQMEVAAKVRAGIADVEEKARDKAR